MNPFLNGWNNIPRRGKIFIAYKYMTTLFDPVGVAPLFKSLAKVGE